MTKLTVANIQSFSMLGNNAACVVAATSKIETAADYAAKIRDRFGGKLEVVPHTVRDVTRIEQAKAVAFHVRAVTESRPIEAAAQMRTVVEANVFADDEDATWQVVEASGVKRLVKRTDTDVSALLQAAAKQNIHRIAASNYDAGLGTVYEGEYALFTNPETASVDGGIVTYGEDGGLRVVSRSTGKQLEIAREAIVAHSAFGSEKEDGEETAAFNKRDAQPLIDYYRNLFSEQPAFFAQLESMIKKRFVLG